MTDDLDDICRNNHGGNARSEDANAATHGRKEKDRARIYAFVQGRGRYGAIRDDVVVALDMLPQTVYPRCSELVRDGDLVKTGERRLTSRGKCQADVLITRTVWAAQKPVQQRLPMQ